MRSRDRRRVLRFVLAAAGAAWTVPVPAQEGASPDAVRWFQATEQALMDAVAVGDKGVWERVLDASFVMTSEEGEVLPRQQLIESLRPLPKGLEGAIAVKELTVQELPTFAVVRYLADEIGDGVRTEARHAVPGHGHVPARGRGLEDGRVPTSRS